MADGPRGNGPSPQRPVSIRLRDGTTQRISFVCDESSDDSSDEQAAQSSANRNVSKINSTVKPNTLDEEVVCEIPLHSKPAAQAFDPTAPDEAVSSSADQDNHDNNSTGSTHIVEEDASEDASETALEGDMAVDNESLSAEGPVADGYSATETAAEPSSPTSIPSTEDETISASSLDVTIHANMVGSVVEDRSDAEAPASQKEENDDILVDSSSWDTGSLISTPGSEPIPPNSIPQSAVHLEDEERLNCMMCPEPGDLRCSRCGARYCGRPCQLLDFPDHTHLCKQLAFFSGSTRPSSNHVRVVVLPRQGIRPEFAWLDLAGDADESVVVNLKVTHPDADWLRQGLDEGDDLEPGTVCNTQTGVTRWAIAHGCNVLRVGGVRNINMTCAALTGLPGHGWAYVGSIVITAILRLGQDGQDGNLGVDIHLRDYRELLHTLRGRPANPCVHENFAAHVRLVQPDVFHEIVPAVKMNDRYTTETMAQNGATIPSLEQVLIRPHHFMDDRPDPCTIPFLVGLMWYLRAARCCAPSLTSNLPAEMAVHLRHTMRTWYVGGMPVALMSLPETNKGPYVIFQAGGARIEYAHIMAINDYFLSQYHLPCPTFTEAGFRAYWDAFKARGVEKGVIAADMVSPYEAQAAAAGPTRVHPNRNDGANPERLTVAIRIVLRTHPWHAKRWYAGMIPEEER